MLQMQRHALGCAQSLSGAGRLGMQQLSNGNQHVQSAVGFQGQNLLTLCWSHLLAAALSDSIAACMQKTGFVSSLTAKGISPPGMGC